jgi:tetratricopeptide (TPR) repeat protein
MLPESQISEEFGVSRETLGKLDALHVVRHAWRVGGKHYELTHDRLAEAVARNRRWRLPRRYRTAAWVAGVGLVLVLGLGIYGLWSYQRSSEWSRTANLLAGSLLDERFQELLDETGGIELREQIQKRIDDYTAGIDPDEESIQRIRGVAERSAGRLATSLGSSEGARVHLASSIAFYEALRSKEPAESRWHLELALSRHEFGAALVAQGYLAEGLREHELALERATAASAGAQDGASRRRALMEMARAHVALGDDLLLQHAFTEALDRFDQALELMRTPGLEGPQGSHGTLMILARSHVGRGDALSELNQVKPAREAYRKALEASQQLRDLDPLKRDVNMLRATAMNRAANAGLEGNDPRKVLEQHQRVLKLADRVLASDPRNVMTQREQAMAGKIVADALARLEQRAKADEMYASALHDMRELVRKDPRNALWRVDLAAMLAASAALPSRERAQARKQLEEAEHLLAEVGAIDGTNAAVLLARVSVLLQLNGFAELPAEARLEYARTAARIATDVRARAPESVSALWLALNALRAEAERIREGSDDPSASEEVDTLRRELLARAVASNPDDPIVLSVRADDLTALGQKAEKPEDARQAFAEAVKLNERVVDAMPDNPGALASLNRAYLDLAGALNKLGKHHEAELVSRTAVRRATAAAKASPGWGALELEKQRAHLWRSEALRERGDQASAAKELKAAEAAARAAVATSPQSAVYRTQLVSLLRGVANERSTAGDHRGAAEAFGRMAAEALQAVPLDPEGTSFLELAWSGHIWQGDALRAAGDLPAAERAYASAVEAATQAATRTPKVPERFDELRAAHSARAGVLAQLERWADSKKAYEAGRRAGESAMGLSGDPIYRTQLASLLVDLAGVQDRSGDPDGALEAYRDAMDAAGAVVAKQPDDAAALRLLYGGHRKLGELLARRGNVREAQVAYGKGLEYARRAAAADPLAAADLGELERLANRARSAE